VLEDSYNSEYRQMIWVSGNSNNINSLQIPQQYARLSVEVFSKANTMDNL
jgi:hypothetical protein